ncbi:MAG TPA: hypothetical protein VM345_17835 [Acidimicrobiales bacterium]|nr:hypothetical protein [Acidimicrobiales bacterium]
MTAPIVELRPAKQRTHGMVACYRDGGCRCDECRHAWTSYKRARRGLPPRERAAAGRKPIVRPFAFEPFERAARRRTVLELARDMCVHPRQVYRWRSEGLTVEQADRFAVEILNRHPSMVWPEWWRVTLGGR